MPVEIAPDDTLTRRLPLPLTQLYRRGQNAKTPLERHLTAFYFWEAGLKLLASAAVAQYQQSGRRDSTAEGVIQSLERPSLGVWWEAARKLTPILADGGDAGYVRIRDILLGRARDDLPRAAGLDAVLRDILESKSGARSTVRVGELFDRLVRWRNEDVGHGAAGQRHGEIYARSGPALLLGALEVFSALDVLAGRRLQFIADVRRLTSGAWLVERMELHGDSPRRLESIEVPEDETARLPRPAWLYLAAPAGDPLPLHPWVIYDEPAGKTLFFNSRRDATRSDYLCYTTGEIVHLSPGASRRPKTSGDQFFDRTSDEAAAGDESAAAPTHESMAPRPGEPGRTLGEFELISRLGRGGMGVVYRAWQPSLGRQVALKCLLRTGDPKSEARFAREIRALGRVEHPNVVKVFTSGAEGDQWFYAMELVEGADLAAVCERLAAHSAADLTAHDWASAISTVSVEQRQREQPLSAAGATDGARWSDSPAVKTASPAPPSGSHAGHIHRVVEIVRQISDAAHALHEAGVIHRDIKPANILLTADGGHAVLMDLGLAQLADEAEGRLTKTRQFVGTLRYASPEQVLAIGRLDRRADVYSLGATLWELLTLQPLFGANENLPTPELMLRIQSTEPDRPQKFNPKIPPDLEAIVLKCLEKDRARRYATASDLADDLGRWLRGEPVVARPVGGLERAARWVQRRPAVAAAWGALALAVLLGGIGGGAIWLWRQAETARTEANIQRERAERAAIAEAEERQRAERNATEAERQRQTAEANAAEAREQRQRADSEAMQARRQAAFVRQTQYAADLKLAARAFLDKRPFEMRALLLGQQSFDNLKGFDWQFLNLLGRTQLLFGPTHERIVRAVAFSADGRRVVSGGGEGAAIVWDADTGREIARTPPAQTACDAVAFHPNGTIIATLNYDGTVKLWNAGTAALLRSLPDAEGSLHGVAFSPDGRWIAYTGVGNVVRVHDVASGAVRWIGRGHGDRVSAVSFSPDGRRLVSGSHDRSVRVWDAETGRELRAMTPYTTKEKNARTGVEEPVEYGHARNVNAVAFSPDGQTIAAGDSDAAVIEWNPSTGRQLRRRSNQNLPITGVAYSPDGLRLAATSSDGTICIWDAATTAPPAVLYGPGGLAFGGQYSPDGTRLVVGFDGGAVCVWDLTVDEDALTSFCATRATGLFLAVSADGRYWAQGRGNGEIVLGDADSNRILQSWKAHSEEVQGVAFSPDGRRLVTIGGDNVARTWSIPEAAMVAEFRGHKSKVLSVAYHPAGRVVATGGEGAIKVWEPDTGRELATLSGHSATVVGLCFRPDGLRLASIGGADKKIVVWDASNWKVVWQRAGLWQGTNGVAYSPDGTRLACALTDGSVIVWDQTDPEGNDRIVIPAHSGRAMGLAFSPDGRRLATGGFDQTVRLWDLATQQCVLTLNRQLGNISALHMTADGRRLIARSFIGIHIWRTDRPMTTPNGYPAWRLQWHRDQFDSAAKAKQWFADAFHVSRLIEIDPEREGVLRPARAYAYLQLDKDEAVIADLDRALELRAPTTAILETRGEAYFRLRKYAKAEADFTKAIDLDKQYRSAWALRGEARSRMRRWAEAIGDYSKALELNSAPASTWRLRGEAHAELGHWTEAAADFQKALERSPMSRREISAFAMVQLGRGDRAAFRRACILAFDRLAHSKQPGDWNTVSWLCSLMPPEGVEPAELAALMERAIAAEPDNYAFRNTLGAALYRAGRFDDAVHRLEEAVQLHNRGGSYEDFLFLAMSRWRLGQRDRARSDFAAAIRLADQRLNPAPGTTIPPLTWDNRLEWQALRSEAEALITPEPAAADRSRGP